MNKVNKKILSREQLKKILNPNERERSMFDEAISLGVRDINYYLPTKQSDEVKVDNG